MRTVNPPASRVRRFESDPYHHSLYKDCSKWIATGYALAMTRGSGYAGMVWYENMLWVSYYSSHEGKTSIYLAKVKFGN